MSKITIKAPSYTTLVLIACLSMFVPGGIAQVVLKNDQGKRIIAYPDGTWEYFDADSTASATQKKREQFYFDNSILEKHKRQAEEAKKYAKSQALELIQARINRVNIEEELTKQQLERFEDGGNKEAELSKALQREKALILEYERAKEWASFLEKMIFIPPAMRDSEIADLSRRIGLPEKLAFLFKADENPVAENSASGQPFKFYKPFSPADDLLLNPPPLPCALAFTGKDKATGKDRRDVEPAILFTHTDRGLEEVFSKRDLITCIGYLTSVEGGLRFLNLEIIIAAGKSPQFFGHLQKGSFAEIKLLNGEKVRLIYNQSDPGTWNPKLEAFIYKCQMPLGAREEKLLRSSELDSIVIRWSKIMEEYEIYELDFIKRQFDCLDNL